MDKKTIRAEIRAKKQSMTDEQIHRASQKLGRLLRDCEAYKNAAAVYGYLSYNQEVRTVPILRQALADGKRLAVPKCYGDEMRFIYLEDLNAVAPGRRGIPEPIADGPVADDPAALVLMPGLAFDRQGRRIGYGGGFYDRFLAREPEHPTVALCYDFQLFSHLETDSHDIPVDLVLSAGG